MPLKKLATLFAALWKRGHPKHAAPKLTFEFQKVSGAGSGYETAEEVPAAKGGAPVRVASGSFRVDWERALEKLQKFQLGNPEEFLAPWLRCAVAGKATRVEATRAGHSLSFSFDGQPLKQTQVRDPFAAPFEDDARGRQLAYGLLGALRLEPSWLSIESGRAGQRVRLAAGGAPASRVRGGTTAIAVGFKGERAESLERALTLLSGAAGFHDCELLVNDTPAPGAPSRGTRFEQGAGAGQVRGFLHILPGYESEVSLYTYGARACRLKRALGLPGEFRVHLRCDALNLDLSQTKVVEDSALERALKVVTKEAGRIVQRMAANASPAEAEWLREAVLDAFDANPELNRPESGSLIEKLWKAPVFASKRGDKLSLERISEAIKIWGPELVLGEDKAIPAVHVSFRNDKERDFLRGFFGFT